MSMKKSFISLLKKAEDFRFTPFLAHELFYRNIGLKREQGHSSVRIRIFYCLSRLRSLLNKY